jgi:hypothetical protein
MDGLHSLKLPKMICNCVRNVILSYTSRRITNVLSNFFLNLSFSEGFDFQTTVVCNGWVMRGENKVSVECLQIFIL